MRYLPIRNHTRIECGNRTELGVNGRDHFIEISKQGDGISARLQPQHQICYILEEDVTAETLPKGYQKLLEGDFGCACGMAVCDVRYQIYEGNTLVVYDARTRLIANLTGQAVMLEKKE